eukprot:GHVL01037653.1.p1 GENE.GHVL01037653.1~~GHVL01037653.1.p1  ORF type:complete len:473 (-),score=124.59 GHVL01037653.1:14-1432(-)
MTIIGGTTQKSITMHDNRNGIPVNHSTKKSKNINKNINQNYNVPIDETILLISRYIANPTFLRLLCSDLNTKFNKEYYTKYVINRKCEGSNFFKSIQSLGVLAVADCFLNNNAFERWGVLFTFLSSWYDHEFTFSDKEFISSLKNTRKILRMVNHLHPSAKEFVCFSVKLLEWLKCLNKPCMKLQGPVFGYVDKTGYVHIVFDTNKETPFPGSMMLPVNESPNAPHHIVKLKRREHEIFPPWAFEYPVYDWMYTQYPCFRDYVMFCTILTVIDGTPKVYMQELPVIELNITLKFPQVFNIIKENNFINLCFTSTTEYENIALGYGFFQNNQGLILDCRIAYDNDQSQSSTIINLKIYWPEKKREAPIPVTLSRRNNINFTKNKNFINSRSLNSDRNIKDKLFISMVDVGSPLLPHEKDENDIDDDIEQDDNEITNDILPPKIYCENTVMLEKAEECLRNLSTSFLKYMNKDK